MGLYPIQKVANIQVLVTHFILGVSQSTITRGGQDVNKAERACSNIAGKATPVVLELSDFSSVRSATQTNLLALAGEFCPGAGDAVDASHVSQGLVGHHLRRVRRLRRVEWGFLVLFDYESMNKHGSQSAGSETNSTANRLR